MKNINDYMFSRLSKPSEWKCYVFGEKAQWFWQPNEGELPNRWVRFWMKVFFYSIWVKEAK